MPYTSHGHGYGLVDADEPLPRMVARCGGPGLCDACKLEAADGQGIPQELRDLPPEVRRLVHAADSMRDHWAEADEARRAELWRELHGASDGVWARGDA